MLNERPSFLGVAWHAVRRTTSKVRGVRLQQLNFHKSDREDTPISQQQRGKTFHIVMTESRVMSHNALLVSRTACCFAFALLCASSSGMSSRCASLAERRERLLLGWHCRAVFETL